MLARLTGWRMLAAAVVAVLVLIWFFTLRPGVLGGPAGYVIVDGTSMEPTYYNGDLVITRKSAQYRPGETIAYWPTTPQVERASLTIHRIIEANERGEFLTIGDNRSEIDQWVARPENVLGKAWLHIPYAGRLILKIREPRNFIVLVAVFAAVTLMRTAVDRRRGQGRQMKHGHREPAKTGLGLYLPTWQMVTMSLLVVAATLFGALAVVGYRLDPTTERRESRITHEHLSAFDYTIAMKRSILYPDGVVGPVGPDVVDGVLQDGASTGAAPVFRKLARSLDLGFGYALSTSLPAEVHGSYSVDLEIVAGDGIWRLSEVIVEPTAFQGGEVAFRVPFDFEAIAARLATVEEESGYQAQRYTLTITPNIAIQGVVGNLPIDEQFQSSFPIAMDQLQITPGSELVNSLLRTESLAVVEVNRAGYGNLTMPVSQARTFGTAGLAATLLITLVVGGMIWLGLRRDEHALIQLRYRPMLVSVSGADLDDGNLERVSLASMQDLARMAQRDGQIIFHQQTGLDRQRYFVRRGSVVYEYCSGESLPASGFQGA